MSLNIPPPKQSNHLKFGRGTLFQLRRRSLAQCFAKDLPRWVFRDRLEEYHPAGDPLRGGDLAVHESGDLLGCGGVTGFEDDVCAWSFVVVANKML